MQDKQNFCPNKISSYFRAEWLPLTFVTLSGLFYNVGLLATPGFEGRSRGLGDVYKRQGSKGGLPNA